MKLMFWIDSGLKWMRMNRFKPHVCLPTRESQIEVVDLILSQKSGRGKAFLEKHCLYIKKGELSENKRVKKT